jgi:hypothetical protein
MDGSSQVRQSLNLDLSKFGREALCASVERQKVEPETLVRQAVLHYLSQRDADRVSARVPAFSRGEQESESSGNGHMLVTIDLEDAEWAALAEAAAAERVSVEGIVKHAVLLFLSDLDQGRATVRTLND